MGSDDVTLKVLIDIRDAVRATNDRVDGTNARVDGTNARVDKLTVRVDGTNSRVDRLAEGIDKLDERVDSGFTKLQTAIGSSEIRTATAINEMSDAIQSVYTLLKDRLELRDRVERCEHDIEDLKRKIG